MLSPPFSSTSWGCGIVRRLWAIASAVALVCALALATGCVSSSEEAAQTPAGAETGVNTALQTDADGATVPAPGADEEPMEPEPAPDANGEADVEGDLAAGEAYFASSCGGCHMGGGNDAGGIGPQLAGMDLSADEIENVVVNGQGAMPGGLASGDDLTNVVAYVVSLQ
jgi:mono/diheme cytochrome c family protein